MFCLQKSTYLMFSVYNRSKRSIPSVSLTKEMKSLVLCHLMFSFTVEKKPFYLVFVLLTIETNSILPNTFQ